MLFTRTIKSNYLTNATDCKSILPSCIYTTKMGTMTFKMHFCQKKLNKQKEEEIN